MHSKRWAVALLGVGLSLVACSGGGKKATVVNPVVTGGSGATSNDNNGSSSNDNSSSGTRLSRAANFCRFASLADLSAALGDTFEDAPPVDSPCAIQSSGAHATRIEWRAEVISADAFRDQSAGFGNAPDPRPVTDIPGHTAFAFTGPNPQGGTLTPGGNDDALETDLVIGVGPESLVVVSASPTGDVESQLRQDIAAAKLLMQGCAVNHVTGC